MTVFDPSEKVEFLATQTLYYDRYSGCHYFLERAEVNGKCGLVCGEEVDDCGTHSKILLEPVYKDIKVRKVSTQKAKYDKYVVFGDGKQIGQFTLVLNAWVPN